MNRIGWRMAYIIAAIGIFLVDQASKAWAVKSLRFGDDKVVVKGLLSFVYAENPGIAFGQLQEGGNFGRWFFIILAICAMVAVLVYFFRAQGSSDRIPGACA